MNDYLNHKWRNWVNEEPRPKKKRIVEDKSIKKSVKTDTIELPQLRLSDNWGKPGNEDRMVVERVFRNIGARGSSPWARISAVNDFITQCDESCRKGKDASEIITNLMFLDVLHALAYEFNQAVGGFLFESFMAAVFGGASAQVPVGGGGIEDITDPSGAPLSIKFFEGGRIMDPKKGKKKSVGSSHVGGSLYDLITSIKPGKPMPYLLVRKMKTSKDVVDEILFYKFTVGTVPGIIRGGTGGGRDRAVSTLVKGDFMVGRDPGVESKGYSAEEDQPDPKTKEGRSRGFLIDGNDFKIPVGQVLEWIDPIATLKFGGPGFLKDLGKRYAELLQEDVTVAFNSLSALTKNLTVYFADDAGKGRAITQAVANANDLQTSVSGIQKGYKPGGKSNI